MNLKEILARQAEIKEQIDSDEELSLDYEALNAELDELDEKRSKFENAKETRSQLLGRIVVDPETRSVSKPAQVKTPEMNYGAESEEYRSAWLEVLRGNEDSMSDAQKRAFTHTTQNTGAVVPKALIDRIYSNMNEEHPILADVSRINTPMAVSIVKHTAITAGDAKMVAENEANVDEQNTFKQVEITVNDFSKHIEISYRLAHMSISSFESYLVQEIGQRLGAVRAADILDTILGTGDKALAPSQFLDAEEAGVLKKGDVFKALGALKNVGNVNIYMTRNTFYTQVAMAQDENLVAYTQDFQSRIPGVVFGYPVKIEDAMEDGQMLFLDPKQYTDNVIQDVLIERDRDIKRHVHIISGHTIAGGIMTNELGGVLLDTAAAEVTP